uniref:Uncharacterized protein n=1 Tax=Anguilla anguilla TaxID=7936 RepID=A0A0E9QFH6_ANGAN
MVCKLEVPNSGGIGDAKLNESYSSRASPNERPPIRAK